MALAAAMAGLMACGDDTGGAGGGTSSGDGGGGGGGDEGSTTTAGATTGTGTSSSTGASCAPALSSARADGCDAICARREELGCSIATCVDDCAAASAPTCAAEGVAVQLCYLAQPEPTITCEQGNFSVSVSGGCCAAEQQAFFDCVSGG